ncbi:MAG: DUF839 domain-containing protein [Gammaproteobacteria bacterium]
MTVKQLMRFLHSLQLSQNISSQPVDEKRRQILEKSLLGAAIVPVAPSLLSACGYVLTQEKVDRQFRNRSSNISSLGPLKAPDENGVRVPEGFSSRIVARTNEKPLKDSNYVWHWAPDGGEVFATHGGGWIYVSNSETAGGAGGAGALVFGVNGDLRDAYSILEGTSRNCSGGKTPWGTWLSCEEDSDGHVWECDPLGLAKARRLDALGNRRPRGAEGRGPHARRAEKPRRAASGDPPMPRKGSHVTRSKKARRLMVEKVLLIWMGKCT